MAPGSRSHNRKFRSTLGLSDSSVRPIKSARTLGKPAPNPGRFSTWAKGSSWPRSGPPRSQRRTYPSKQTRSRRSNQTHSHPACNPNPLPHTTGPPHRPRPSSPAPALPAGPGPPRASTRLPRRREPPKKTVQSPPRPDPASVLRRALISRRDHCRAAVRPHATADWSQCGSWTVWYAARHGR